MNTMSATMHKYVEAKLAGATRAIETAQRETPPPAGYTNFDRAIRIIDECRAAIDSSWEVDKVAQHLRATARVLEQLSSGSAARVVAQAIRLIDQAIGGETM
jgi:hypothetical protein